ncbi:MAG: hypothetical protein J07HX64_01348 [halophilic archaeon J07HX64]|jgi:hypothetical protein|nr:MAG: hypothetical protein J07HX64_01348 [halophilic archaeon J07HX64]
MSADVPPDVEAVLTQLFEEAQKEFESGDPETGVEAVTSAATVVRTKLPEGELRAQMLHGCERVEALAGEGGNTAVAAEYVAATERRLDEAVSD